MAPVRLQGILDALGTVYNAQGVAVKPRGLIAYSVAYTDFMDSGGATGYIDFADMVPAGALVKRWAAFIQTAFAGGTNASAVATVGTAAVADRFTSGTDPSVFTGTVGTWVGKSPLDPNDINANSAPNVLVAVQPRLTITVNVSWATITAGALVFYLEYDAVPLAVV